MLPQDTTANTLSFEEVFGSFDFNGDGNFAVADFQKAIRAVGLPVKKKDIREIEDEIRVNHNGYVNLPLFKE